MSEIRIVEVYGIKIDVRAAALLEIVLKFGGANSDHKCHQANTALEKLGDLAATVALQHIVKEFSGTNSNHKCHLANRALELI